MRRLVVVAALLAAAVVVAPRGTGAQDSLEAMKRRELEEVRARARQNREAATRLRGQENKALGSLRRTERELNTTRKRLRQIQAHRGRLDQQLRTTRARHRRSMLTLEERREQLGQRLRSLYKYQAGRELEFLLSTTSFAQLLARWDYLVMIAEQDRIMIEDVLAQKELVEADQRRIEYNLEDLQRTNKRTSKENERLATLRSQRAQNVAQIQTQREAYEAAAVEAERTARAIQRLLTDLEKRRRDETTRARAEGRVPQPYTGNFAQGEGRLDWPVEGEIVGRFGPEKHPRWGTMTVNNGIDIETPVGTPVRAVAKGRVDYTSEDFGAYGQIVVLNHGDGYYTLYGHLSSIAVSVGSEVQPGQTIARSGDTGSLKGPVLHFEVRKGGASLNPESWLR